MHHDSSAYGCTYSEPKKKKSANKQKLISTGWKEQQQYKKKKKKKTKQSLYKRQLQQYIGKAVRKEHI